MPLRNTKSPSQFSSSHRTDLRAHESNAYAERAPNHSLTQTSNSLYGLPLRDTKSPSQFTSTHQDLQPHEASAYAERAPNMSLHPGTHCLPYHQG